jgi:hypothetical protein
MLTLAPVPDDQVIGIYKVNGAAAKMPARMRRLHPTAKEAFLSIMKNSKGIIISDMFRSAESSLQAVSEKRGALAPSFSGHNFGFSIDVDVSATMKRLGIKTKPDFDTFMRTYNWYCHRRDGKREFEEWHYDCDVDGLLTKNLKPSQKTTQQAREAMIQAHYSAEWNQDAKMLQTQLKALGLYSGAIDGKLGPLSAQAISAFQRTWKLKVTGKAEAREKRLLWFVYESSRLPAVTI